MRELQTDLRIDRLFLGTGAVLMDADSPAIDENILKVRIMAQSLEKPFPDTVSAPAVEALIHAVPLAEIGWQNPPMRARPRQPQDRLDKQSIVPARPTRITRLARQMRLDTRSNNVTQFLSIHPC